jgi:LacI family sucrose operon transcriptional repressor
MRQYDTLVLRLFEEHPDVEGIFAGSDVIAASVMKICHQRKKRIPEDIKVVGYDDVSIASFLTPQLTTIRQPIEDMGRLAVELIHKQINKETVTVENILPVTLVERETT